MSGQTLREKIEQEVQYLLEQTWGTAWTEDDCKVYQHIVDWAVARAESVIRTVVDFQGSLLGNVLQPPLNPQGQYAPEGALPSGEE